MRRTLTLSILLTLFAGGVWAEKLNLCYMYTTHEDSAMGFMHKNIDKCNDGDVLEFYFSSSSGAVRTVALYCNQDKQITLEDGMGVCTLKLYSEIKTVSPEGPGAKKIREEMVIDMKELLGVERMTVEEFRQSAFFNYLSKEDRLAQEERIRLREKPDQ